MIPKLRQFHGLRMNHEEQNIKINKDKGHNSGKGHEDLESGETDTGDNGNSCFLPNLC